MTDSLFPEAAQAEASARRAPDELNPAEMRELSRWAEQRVPWVSRGALDCLASLEGYADDCLSYFQAKKTMRVSWVATVKTWIRKDEQRRLEAMARRGNESARLALRDPARWRDDYDRKDRAVKTISVQPTELLTPRAAAPSASLTRRAD